MRSLTTGMRPPSAQSVPIESFSKAYRNLTNESFPSLISVCRLPTPSNSNCRNDSVSATANFHFLSKLSFVWRLSSRKTSSKLCSSMYVPCSKTKRHLRYSSNVSAALVPMTIDLVRCSCSGIFSAKTWQAWLKASAVRKIWCGFALFALACFGFTVLRAMCFVPFGFSFQNLGSATNVANPAPCSKRNFDVSPFLEIYCGRFGGESRGNALSGLRDLTTICVYVALSRNWKLR